MILNKKIARFILETKAFQLGPLFSSFGQKIFFDFDLRCLASHPQALKEIGKELAKIIRNYSVDLIAGGETAGIFIATSTALSLGKGMIYLRKSPKSHRFKKQIEGIFQKRDKIALVDDNIYLGRQKRKWVEILEKNDLKVKVIVTLLGSREKNYPWMKKKRIAFHFLCDRGDLMAYLLKKKALPQEVYFFLQRVHQNFLLEVKKRKNWEKLKELKRRYRKYFS